MLKIGAHVSAAGTLATSLERATDIEAECTQIFLSPPQMWIKPKHADTAIQDYIRATAKSGISPNFVHSVYLVNLAAEDPVHLQKSIDWLTFALNLASQLKIQGVIVHTGSHKGKGFDAVFDRIVKSISTILASVPDDVQLILENCAGSGGAIGSSFVDLGKILKAAGDSRLKVCLDTQHAFASGYNLGTKDGIEATFQEFEQEIGLENLVCLHINDSKTGLESKVDRHENLGVGLIGLDGITRVVRFLESHTKTDSLPLILEVPGFEDKGPDLENVRILKGLRSVNK